MKSAQVYVKKIISYLTQNKLRLHSKDLSLILVQKSNSFWFVVLARNTLWEKYRVVKCNSRWFIYFRLGFRRLTLMLLTWRIGRAHNNARK